jgi:hypothetical protein
VIGAPQRAFLGVPSSCRDDLRGSPQAQATVSPWVKEQSMGSPPVGGCEPGNGSLSKVFQSCGKMFLNPAAPLGLDYEGCSECAPVTVESCLQIKD